MDKSLILLGDLGEKIDEWYIGTVVKSNGKYQSTDDCEFILGFGYDYVYTRDLNNNFGGFHFDQVDGFFKINLDKSNFDKGDWVDSLMNEAISRWWENHASNNK